MYTTAHIGGFSVRVARSADDSGPSGDNRACTVIDQSKAPVFPTLAVRIFPDEEHMSPQSHLRWKADPALTVQ